MMKIEFEKIYSHKSNTTIPSILVFPIFLILIPIILAGLIIFLIWACIGALFSIGRKDSQIIEQERKPYFLIEKDNVTIELAELDYEENSLLIDYWSSDVYDEGMTLYLSKTNPEIPGLHNKIITTFMKELKEGVLLQTVEYPEKVKDPVSRIIYLEYSSLNIEILDQIGPYCLYIKGNEEDIISGFNQGGKIQLKIKLQDGM